MFQEAMIVGPKLTSKQGLEKLLFDHLLIVVVEGLKVVEGARVLVQEFPEEGGPAPVGCRDQDVPDLVTLLGQQGVAQGDGGKIQRFSQLITYKYIQIILNLRFNTDILLLVNSRLRPVTILVNPF